MKFANRTEAGKNLAEVLAKEKYNDPLVLAIPRGGVVVAHPVAQALAAELDIIIPRKIGSPYNPEIAIGAIAPDGTVVLNRSLITYLKLTEEDLKSLIDQEMHEIERRTKTYRGTAEPPLVNDRSVILVDDGIATGLTVLAALKGLKMQKPSQLILAVPVAPQDTLDRLYPEVDDIVCLLIPGDFQAVGQFYTSFDQTSDEEVLRLLGN
ncbi:MAG TPA: phosphoribosyltransferase [Clostridia bacterium]|jgi:predicted phosphoribosyltransferase|nr:phosphoribosyltransferase [Clostridia bacterium]